MMRLSKNYHSFSDDESNKSLNEYLRVGKFDLLGDTEGGKVSQMDVVKVGLDESVEWQSIPNAVRSTVQKGHRVLVGDDDHVVVA